MTTLAWRLFAAYGAVYVIWGSTFLATRWSVETIPPLAMASARCLVAGAVLLAFAGMRRARHVTRGELAAATTLGALYFLGCHGLLVIALTRVASGVAALFAATIPLWVPLLAWSFGGARPQGRTVLGAALGLVGVALLVFGGEATIGAPRFADAALLLGSALCWAAGAAVAPKLPRGADLVVATGLQLAIGGGLLAVVAFLHGEAAALHGAAFGLRSVASFAYLTLFGTLVAFAAFSWLLTVEPPSRVVTYAFVNPVIAVLLGWAIADEALSPMTLAATAIIVAAVAMIVIARR